MKKTIPYSSIALVMLLMLSSSTALSDQLNCEGRPIAAVRINGCDGLWCQTQEEQKKLLSIIALKKGDKWQQKDINRGLALCMETGFFRTVTAQCKTVAGSLRVVAIFNVTPNRWVQEVKIEGNVALFKSDIKKRLLLREGMAFNPDDAAAKDLQKRQKGAIARLYQKKGFDNAVVNIIATKQGTTGVDIRVSINEGKKSKISSLSAVIEQRLPLPGSQQFGPEVVCPKISKRQLRIASELSIGDVLTSQKIRQAKRVLRSFLRAKGYIDPKVSVAFQKADGSVNISARFDRCYVLRFKVRDDPSEGLEGYSDADPSEFVNELTFAETGNFDVREAEENRRRLESWYQSQGYLFTNVLVEHRQSHKLRGREPGVFGMITFYATRSYVNEIRGIKFAGNKVFTDTELKEFMQTKTYDFFGEGGYLLIDQMFADLTRIRAAYRDKGFYTMTFLNAADESAAQKTSVTKTETKGIETLHYSTADLHFRVKKHRHESVIYIEIGLNEGVPSKTGQIDIEGWDDVATLRTKLILQPGSSFSHSKVAEDRGRILLHFQRLGYHQVALETKCHTKTQTVDECRWENVEAPIVNINHSVIPGEQFVVGSIFIRGNHNTQTSLIVDELPRTGEPLDRIRLEESERKLRSLGVFSGVRINPIGLKATPPQKNVSLVTIVQERKAQYLDISGGFESLTVREGDKGLPLALTSSMVSSVGIADAALRGPSSTQPVNVPDLLLFTELKYRHRNFLGRAMELQVPIKYGFSTGFTKDDMHRLGHVSATVYDPFLFGSDYALETTVFGRYDRATKEEDEYEFGGQIAISKSYFKRLNSRLQFTASGIQSGDFLKDPKPGEGLPFTPLRPKLEVAFQTSLDFLDNPANPSKGFAVGASVSYINISKADATKESDNEVFGNFLRWETNVRLFLNLRQTIILAILLRYGDSYSFTEDHLPQVKRFRLGGIWGVRGFDDDSIRPTSESGEPIGGDLRGGDSLLTSTVELRFPILKRLNLWGSTFFDVGALSESTTSFHARSFRTSVGMGVRYLFLGQVPLRLDVAVNLDRRCMVDEDSIQKECILEPLAVPQFSLLYTF